MLKYLHIQNFATIEDIEVKFKEGFTVLTGETGAGKSIIIDGIRLALGEKGDIEKIRTGKDELRVEAIFLGTRAATNSQILIQRTLSRDGTARAYVNGVLMPLKKIKTFGPDLVDIYGQNDHIFLRNKEFQLDYLDEVAGLLAIREEVTHLAQQVKKLLREKEKLSLKEAERRQRLDFLKFQINEIEKAELKTGEEEELIREREILRNAERVQQLVEEMLALGYEEDLSLSNLLTQMLHRLRELKNFEATFEEMEKAFEEFNLLLKEYFRYLFDFKEKYEVSPEKLDGIEARLSMLEKLKRKYGPTVPEILAYLDKAREEYQLLSSSEEKLTELGEKLKDLEKDYRKKADQLSQARKKFATEFNHLVEKEIKSLGMTRARFEVKFEFRKFPPDSIVHEKGWDEVEFLISPNPGEELKPLRRIASGGELSRLMLALKVIGKTSTGKNKTLIFDEIDSGIGGKTAEAVAAKLAQLARNHQVICITHLPQIAVVATHHYRIEKAVKGGRTFTRLQLLNFEERVKEIARLTVGSRLTETALKNAREMLLHHHG
jgi:DNA repair protein RecN (Recombination protein N)